MAGVHGLAIRDKNQATLYMTESSRSPLKESVSALVDGEVNELDLQRVLTSMGKSDEARDTWARYHLMSNVVKSDQHIDLSVDLSAAIRDAIDEESGLAKVPASLHSWWSGVGKTAVAAMVTFGVVVGVQQYGTNPELEGENNIADAAIGASNANNGAVVPQGFELPPLRARTVSTNNFTDKESLPRSSVERRKQGAIVVTNEEFQKQIDRLMFKHAEQVSSSGGLGAIPYTRVSELGDKGQE